ncbi:MAG TPA: MlaD family protein [Candidatus Eremiobacteraceae bacterium]|nr:MlaD family protein [Candidatus Eremiobacteraceae bacterium]
MTTAFKVGVFAVFGVVAIFVVWAVLGNFSLRRNSYEVAIHFRNVVGLQTGSSVQIAGVDIGVVDSIKLLPDQTATVVCSIDADKTLYRGSIFTVTPTLTGAQSTLTIIPPRDLATAIPLPRRILPEAEQPEGVTPPTIADLMSEGQKRLADLDKTLALLNTELPGMVRNFNGVATHTNALIVHADQNFNQLGEQLNMTVGSVNSIVAQLNGLLAVNGRNVTEITTGMRQLIATGGPKVSELIANLTATSDNLNKTMSSLQSITTDPKLKANLTETAANLKDSSEKLKAIATDIQNVTGDPQVQNELKGTVHNLNEAIAKANIILGHFATAQTTSDEGVPGGAQTSPAPGMTPSSQSPLPPVAPHSVTGLGRSRGAPFELVGGEVRLNWNHLPSGPASDLNVVLLPSLPTHVTFGANDLGYNTTYNFLVNWRTTPNLETSFGVLYSNLGLRERWHAVGPFSVDARLYNSKQPRLDLYGDLRLTQRLYFFYGEKSLFGPASTRTPQFGLELGRY